MSATNDESATDRANFNCFGFCSKSNCGSVGLCDSRIWKPPQTHVSVCAHAICAARLPRSSRPFCPPPDPCASSPWSTAGLLSLPPAGRPRANPVSHTQPACPWIEGSQQALLLTAIRLHATGALRIGPAGHRGSPQLVDVLHELGNMDYNSSSSGHASMKEQVVEGYVLPLCEGFASSFF
ncbi:hypothetical protein BS78_07G106800 [Paspalum vaginatum]|nr:hypothetical protein BS78_07G106800 [Paspalum vaginatum]